MAQLIDPRIARVVAHRFTGDSDFDGAADIARLRSNLQRAVPYSEDLVEEASGITRPAPVKWSVVDRGTWAEANIAGMAKLIEPIGARLSRRIESLPPAVRMAQRAALSAEIGVLLGYISRRVLGQYDVLVTEGSDSAPNLPALRLGRRRSMPEGTVLYFVGRNIVETERRLGFVPEDFALWVAVHEVTHRFQFAGVPWLKDRFVSLISSYMGSMQFDARGLAGRLATAVRKLASGEVPPEERNPVYLLASEEQRQALDELQALMAIVEGHGNFIMDTVGAAVIPSFERMRAAFDKRRKQATILQRIVNQAIGLEMKLRQYELGQQFCNQVAAVEGPAALAGLWTSPSMLPTMAELRNPRLWLARVA